MIIRLNKYIAQSGLTSRRKADDLIVQGKVEVNGNIVSELGRTIDAQLDEVSVNGTKIKGDNERLYYVLNKPRGYICSDKKYQGEMIAKDLIPEQNIYSVGRLDKDSTGLIIFTNDGTLKQRVSQPSFECEKEYMVKLNRPITKEELAQLRNGVEIEVEEIKNEKVHRELFFAKPLSVQIITNLPYRAVILMTIREGKKRQIRLMMERIGFPHIQLKRIRIGKI